MIVCYQQALVRKQLLSNFGEIAARLASPACPRKPATDGVDIGPNKAPNKVHKVQSMAGFLGHAGLAILAAISPKVRQNLVAY